MSTNETKVDLARVAITPDVVNRHLTSAERLARAGKLDPNTVSDEYGVLRDDGGLDIFCTVAGTATHVTTAAPDEWTWMQ